MHKEEDQIKDTFLFRDLENEPDLYKRWTQYNMSWYIKKANRNKCCFYVFSIITIVFPILNALFQNSVIDLIVAYLAIDKEVLSFFSTAISLMASLAGSLLALFNFREKWNLYRTAAEKLKSEYVEFEVKADKTPQDIEEYVCRMNRYMEKIHNKWKQVSFSEKQEEKVTEKESTL